MSSLHISNDNEYISLDSLDAETLESIREVTRLGGVLHWDREGEVRTVSNGVMIDVLEVYDYWKSAPEKYQVDAPEAIGRIYWGDTHSFRHG